MASHVVNEAHALAYGGRFRAAREVVRSAIEGARTAGARPAIVWFEVVLGEIDRDSGRGNDAIHHFTVAADMAREAGQDAALVWALVGIAQGHLLVGNGPEAEAALARADEQNSPLATSGGTRERTRAWLMAGRGGLGAARVLLAEVAEAAREDALWNFECGVVHDLVRFGDPEAGAGRLAELELIVDGPYVAALASHARAAAARDVEQYDEAVKRLASLECNVLAAEASMEQADLLRRAGSTRAAVAAVRRAVGLVEAVGGARTPALLRGASVEPLSHREREVALMAAQGATSNDIASQLFISKRTVDSHLNSTYRKLGVAGRDELGLALDPASGSGTAV